MKNLSNLQRNYLDRLLAQDKNIKIRWHDGRGVAAVMQGQLLSLNRINVDPAKDPEKVLEQFLKEWGPLVAPENILKTFRFVKVHKSKDGYVRIRALQTAEDIPIRGATLLLFADAKRGVFRVQSGCYRDVDVPPLVFRRRPVNIKLREKYLRRRLLRNLSSDDEGRRFLKRKQKEGFGEDKVAEKNFPLAAPPVYWLYPYKGGFRHAFRLHAYQPVEWLGVNGELRKSIDLADLVVDIITGRTVSKGTRFGVWVDVAADGQSTLEESGSYITRPLLAVREDGADRLLVNQTNSTDIVTHDAGGTETGLVTKLQNGTDISRDANGHWNDTTTNCAAADRRDSQQPETDAHFLAEQAYQYYDQFGWEGFDNGEWGASACTVRVAAHIGLDDNAYFWRYISGGRHFGYLAFYEGSCSGGSVNFDFMAGDPGIFAHEYQHAVTYFGSVDGSGDPGYLETSNWHRAIHEAISDSAAGLRTQIWTAPGLWPSGVNRDNLPFRRIEYPRSLDTKNGIAYCDHYDDRVGAGSPYTNSTILSHAIYLAGQGGVHERSSRAAELIPVTSASHLKIGEILHHAVTEYFDNIPANTDGVQTMIEAANLILDAAENITGSQRSCEFVMLRRAFYAVGLYPFDASFTKQNYGGEACMLPWTIAWKLSRPYIGFPALWWQSPDLFIHNGSGPDYDADVGAENKLFARVRNIGDQDLTNVVVKFYFRAHGTALPASSTMWKACKDSGGNDCVLTIPTLAAGSMNFTNTASPPASQAVKWFLDATEVVAGVDHFCLRAVIECSADNHDHDCPNQVQSNVSFTPLSAGMDISFVVANWGKEPIPLDLDINKTDLPEGAKLHYSDPGSIKEIKLSPNQEIALHWKLELPPAGLRWMKPPLDGTVKGTVSSKIIDRGKFEGVISDVIIGKFQIPTRAKKIALTGRLAGYVTPGRRRVVKKLLGQFKGTLDLTSGQLTGVWTTVLYQGRRSPKKLDLKLSGILQPTRAIHFAQRIDGELVGGVTYAVRWTK